MAMPPELSEEHADKTYNNLADARAIWEDFLTHWRRGLNRCDAEGAQSRRESYVSSNSRVMADLAPAYLWAARNAEVHGVAEIATMQERTIAIDVFGGYQEEEVERGPNGEHTFPYTPSTPDPPPFFAVLPEHIRLVAIKDRTTDVPVPRGYDYDLGQTPAPVTLAAVGLEFLQCEGVNLAPLQ